MGGSASRARWRSKPVGRRRVSGSVHESAARAKRGNAVPFRPANSRHSRRWAAGLVYSFLKRPDRPGTWRAFPPASDVYGDRRQTSVAKVAKVATYAKMALEH